MSTKKPKKLLLYADFDRSPQQQKSIAPVISENSIDLVAHFQ